MRVFIIYCLCCSFMSFLACVTFINYSSFTWEQKDHREITELNADLLEGDGKLALSHAISRVTHADVLFSNPFHIHRDQGTSKWTKTVYHFGNLINIDM